MKYEDKLVTVIKYLVMYFCRYNNYTDETFEFSLLTVRRTKFVRTISF